LKKSVSTLLLLVTLFSTMVAVPLYSYVPAIYGRPSITDLGFIKDYIMAWWQKIVRRYIYGEVGPAENATVDTQQAQQYKTPTAQSSGEPSDIYQLINYLKQNEAQFSSQIHAYLQESGLPNKSTQIDLLIVPENIYLTFIWDETSLSIYDGWIGDQNCKEYLQATVTSDLLMNLYANRGDIETCKALVLNAEAKGEMAYTIKRLNPTIAEWVLYLQAISTIFSIIGWVIFFKNRLGR